jgi:hypothetical protein
MRREGDARYLELRFLVQMARPVLIDNSIGKRSVISGYLLMFCLAGLGSTHDLLFV